MASRYENWVEESHLEIRPWYVVSAQEFSVASTRTVPAYTPAVYSSCIAVGGINHDFQPWFGSCRGSAVAVSAPGEFVWCATRKPDDLAYTVCLERYTASVQGGPPETPEYRSTHVYRREAGGWRAVHRHADRQPASE